MANILDQGSDGKGSGPRSQWERFRTKVPIEKILDQAFDGKDFGHKVPMGKIPDQGSDEKDCGPRFRWERFWTQLPVAPSPILIHKLPNSSQQWIQNPSGCALSVLSPSRLDPGTIFGKAGSTCCNLQGSNTAWFSSAAKLPHQSRFFFQGLPTKLLTHRSLTIKTGMQEILRMLILLCNWSHIS